MRFAPHAFTLRQLQYVVAVADHRSFRRAAEACHVAQPSLSVQVAQVEDALGVQLFERGRRGVTVTPPGEAVVARARALCVDADALGDAARGLSDPLACTMRLGLIPTIGPYLLPEVAPALREAYPRMHFVWVEDKTSVLVQQIAAGALDGAILALEADIGDLRRVVLGEDEFVFAAPASHPLARGKRPLRPEELDGEKVLLLDDGHCFREQALSFCAKAGAEEVGYRATSLPTLVQMAAGGEGVTLLPRMAVAQENRREALEVRAFAKKAPARTVALVWRKGAALERALDVVGKTLQKTYAALVRRDA